MVALPGIVEATPFAVLCYVPSSCGYVRHFLAAAESWGAVDAGGNRGRSGVGLGGVGPSLGNVRIYSWGS